MACLATIFMVSACNDDDDNAAVLPSAISNLTATPLATGLHFRAFHLLTLAASHDLKETIDKDYCECGMPLETIRESEAPLKERSERV